MKDEIEDGVEAICSALSTLNDTVEGVFDNTIGPCKEPESLTAGVHRVTDALDRIATALEERNEKVGGVRS